MKPMVMDVDVNTGDITNREMTDEEYAVYLRDQETLANEVVDDTQAL